MIYQVYQAHADAAEPPRLLARTALDLVAHRWSGMERAAGMRNLTAAYEVLARTRLTHTRPDFGIDMVMVGNREVEVRQEAVHRTSFGTLLRFKKDVQAQQPAVLLISPMSGHFATLLRDTVRTMLPEHDIYVTDWHNARDIPLRHGRFDFDDFIEHVITFLEVLGEGAHVVAICQPSVAALAAAAIMAEDGNIAQPRSLTLMAGPIDTRVNPTRVNEFATSRSIGWFERQMIGIVPLRYRGALRRVYPGFLQLAAFMSMNLDRHLKSFRDLYDNLVKGDMEKADVTRKFYEEYFAVMDLPAEFYLQTIRSVFQEHDLPRGELRWRGRRVDTRAIRRTQLLTVEGEKDDICSVGQTLAAQDLCSSLRPYMKRHYLQTNVGHYGVFSGRRWNTQIYPMLRLVIEASG
jgi:poly(3-hydroxybutyrate) depolymerase